MKNPEANPKALRSILKGIAEDRVHRHKLLLCHILDCSIPELMIKHSSLRDAEYLQYTQMAAKLESGIPVQYIIGYAHFYGLKLLVNPDVLIPRPETEGLVELAIKKLKHGAKVLDIGTGSGAIALAMKHLRPDIHVLATDISASALELARQNSSNLDLEIDFQLCDLFPNAPHTFDLIISNPPYISESEYLCLPAEVKDHEPRLALVADANGLAIYRRIFEQAHNFLDKNAEIRMEIGELQADALLEMASFYGYRDASVSKDLCGRDRYFYCAK